MKLVSTLDFFYPNVLSPYNFGRISVCNVLSDLYAMGITHPTSISMILGVSNMMDQQLQDKVAPLMIQGFQSVCQEAKVLIEGGQTVINPWVMMGGSAVYIGPENSIRMPNFAEPGDKLVLTKPLGTQIASNAMQWLLQKPENAQKILKVMPKQDIEDLFERAEQWMAKLSKPAAQLMHKHKSKACTDITGFGVLGHASYLAKAQKLPVNLILERLPIHRNAIRLQKIVRDFKILEGYSAETSGGLLIALGSQSCQPFIEDIRNQGGQAWIVGRVEKGERKAVLQKCQVVEC